MQLAKGSAEDLLSGLAANFRAFDFTRLSIERVVITDGLKKDVCLSSARRSRADLYQDKHTSNRQHEKNHMFLNRFFCHDFTMIDYYKSKACHFIKHAFLLCNV